MLRNLPPRHVTEVAIAAAQLLPELPGVVSLLEGSDSLPSLVAAFLEEHSAADIDTMAGQNPTEDPLLCHHIVWNVLLSKVWVCDGSCVLNATPGCHPRSVIVQSSNLLLLTQTWQRSALQSNN